MINVEFSITAASTPDCRCYLCGRIHYIRLIKFRNHVNPQILSIHLCDKCREELSATLKAVG
jgi:hypothetical protein